MSYFKLGVEGEGFVFFLPDTFKKPLKILGSGIRRSINGTARRDVVATKHMFELGFDFLSESEYQNFLHVFHKNVTEKKDLTFVDDEGTYTVMWGSDGFGLDERKQDSEIFWSGVIMLEEI